MINLLNRTKNKEFYQQTLIDNFKEILPIDDAKFLAMKLVEKYSINELNSFILSPIVVINGENSQKVDNDFIKQQLMKKGNYDVLANLDKAKIIICNCNNISIVGLDVVYLFDNKIRLISPKENAIFKNEIFLAKNNKIINSVNVIYKLSVDNAIKNVLHSEFDKVVNTRMLNVSPTCVIECDYKSRPFQVKRQFFKSPDGNTYTIFNPTQLVNENQYSVFEDKNK